MAAPAVGKKPNFLVILADDMGFSDAGCYGGEVETPNLDKLAAGGLRFSQMYSTARCGPSRSCILSGYYAQQTACDVMTPGRIPAWTKLAPEYLKPFGYRSYHSGKWHIRFKPVAGAGFDHSYLLQDQNRFFSPRQHLLDDNPLPEPKSGDGFYATTAIADHAVKFLQGHAREHAANRFYMYLAFTSPHFPLHALQEDIDMYKDKFADGWDAQRERHHSRLRRMGMVNCPLAPLEPDMRPSWNTKEAELIGRIGAGEVTAAVPWSSLTPEQKKFQQLKMAIHAAMITRMDREIGRVLKQLKKTGDFENTLILFLSDNGASSEQLIRADGHDPAARPGSGASHLCLGPGWASASNAPFRLHKSWVHEGGISSPFIVHWPAGIRERGKIRHTAGHFIDVVPTMIDLAGGGIPRVDDGVPPMRGRSLVPAFQKDGTGDRDYLYFNHANNRAIRVDGWKLVAAGKDSPWEMYDMRRDRSEQQNVIAQHPAKSAEMSALWLKMDAEYVRLREAASASTKPRIDNR
jgi:arylsulfatase